MVKVSLAEIEEVTRAALVAHGAEDWIAGEVARAVREAESHGNRICGLYYLESYCQQLESGRVKGDVAPEVSRPRPGAVVVDARLGFAQPAFARGLPEAVAAARECGVASLAICHAHTCTSLGFFTEQIARQGLIALGMTNASPIVAPPGGKTRVIGTNPISFAVPDGEAGIAMLFDQSTTTVALGKIIDMWATQPTLEMAQLADVGSPVLVMAGEFDSIDEAHTRAMAAALPNAELFIVPGQDHFAPLMAPETVNPHIEVFLN